MISSIDPIIALKALKNIDVLVRILYETSEENYTMTNTTSNLFGPQTEKFTLPPDHRYLEIEIIRLKLANEKETKSLASSHFEYILGGIQNHITQYIYDTSQVNLVKAYLGNIASLNRVLQRTLKILITVEQEDKLWNQGYNPELIDDLISRFRTNLSNKITENLIKPLESWILHLISLTEPSTSMRTLRRVVQVFSGITPHHSERRKYRNESCFVIVKTSYFEQLPLLFECLQVKGLIERQTKLEEFVKIFSNTDSSTEKIVWTGFIGELQQFIRLMIKRRLIHHPLAEWVTTDLFFKKRGVSNLRQSLGHNQGTKITSKMNSIDSVLSEIVRKPSNSG